MTMNALCSAYIVLPIKHVRSFVSVHLLSFANEGPDYSISMVTRPLHWRAATHTYQECRLRSDLTTACVQNNLERQSAPFRLDTFVHKYE